MMNERIEKLSHLAWTKTSEAVPFCDSIGNISRDFNFKYVQMFAELIVRECAKLAGEESSWPHNSYSEKIKKHFGVEE